MWNPGVTDISGQLRAQGMIQSSNNLAGNFGSMMQDWTQRQEQAKTAMAAVKGTAQFLKTNSHLLGVDENTVADLTTQQPNESPMAWQTRMGAFLSQTMQAPALKEASAKTAQYQSAADTANFELAATKKDNAAMAAAMPFLNNPYDFAKAVVANGGRIESIAKNPFVAGIIAKVGQNVINPTNVETLDKEGRPASQTLDQRTGLPMGPIVPKVPAGVLMPEDAAKAAELTDVAKSHVADNNTVHEQAKAAYSEIPQIQKAIELLNDPEVKTGVGAGFLLKAKQLGKTLGIDVGNVQNSEQLQAILGQNILDKVTQMKGALSDKDVRFLDTISSSMGKTNPGNVAILTGVLNAMKNLVEQDRIIRQGRAKGAREGDIVNARYNFLEQNPVFSSLDNAVPPDISSILQKYPPRK